MQVAVPMAPIYREQDRKPLRKGMGPESECFKKEEHRRIALAKKKVKERREAERAGMRSDHTCFMRPLASLALCEHSIANFPGLCPKTAIGFYSVLQYKLLCKPSDFLFLCNAQQGNSR